MLQFTLAMIKTFVLCNTKAVFSLQHEPCLSNAQQTLGSALVNACLLQPTFLAHGLQGGAPHPPQLHTDSGLGLHGAGQTLCPDLGLASYRSVPRLSCPLGQGQHWQQQVWGAPPWARGQRSREWGRSQACHVRARCPCLPSVPLARGSLHPAERRLRDVGWQACPSLGSPRSPAEMGQKAGVHALGPAAALHGSQQSGHGAQASVLGAGLGCAACCDACVWSSPCAGTSLAAWM